MNPKLSMRTSATHYVQADDLDQYVSQVYGHEFNFVVDQECGNDSEHHFLVTSTTGPYENDALQDFRDNGEYMFLTQALLDDMCDSGLIPQGEYIVEVSW